MEIHHGGFFCGAGKNRVYLDGKVDWFDHIKVKYWSFYGIDEIILMLDYGLENVNVHWLLPEMELGTGLRIVDSDRETNIMKQVAYKIKNFVLYFDQYTSLDDNAWEDIVFSDRKVAPQKDVDVGSEGIDKDGSTDGEFVDSDYEVDDDDDDLFYDNVDDGVVDEGAVKGIIVSKGKKRNAPYGKENMITDREWDELSSDEDELELSYAME